MTVYVKVSQQCYANISYIFITLIPAALTVSAATTGSELGVSPQNHTAIWGPQTFFMLPLSLLRKIDTESSQGEVPKRQKIYRPFSPQWCLKFPAELPEVFLNKRSALSSQLSSLGRSSGGRMFPQSLSWTERLGAVTLGPAQRIF